MWKLKSKVMIRTILMIFLITLSINLVNAQNVSKVLYTKTLFKDNFGTEYNGFQGKQFEITIKAFSSTNYYITINDNYRQERKEIKLNKEQLENFTAALETYIKWHKIVTEKGVNVVKKINSISINDDDMVSQYSLANIISPSLTQTQNEYTYKKIVYEFNNDKMIIDVIGYYTSEYNHERRYGSIFTIDINAANVPKIYSKLTGQSFKKTRDEIEEKIGVWDELKR
jgi:hypothetical protein